MTHCKLFPEYPDVLVFSKYFRAGFGAFSMLKYRVKGGTNLCNLWVILMLKTYLMFISVVVVHFVCHYWLIDVQKTKGTLILFTFFLTKGIFTSVCDAWCQTLHAENRS